MSLWLKSMISESCVKVLLLNCLFFCFHTCVQKLVDEVEDENRLGVPASSRRQSVSPGRSKGKKVKESGRWFVYRPLHIFISNNSTVFFLVSFQAPPEELLNICHYMVFWPTALYSWTEKMAKVAQAQVSILPWRRARRSSSFLPLQSRARRISKMMLRRDAGMNSFCVRSFIDRQ